MIKLGNVIDQYQARQFIGEYLIYLRKSQMDRDFEDSSVEETLKRHKKKLTDFCERNGINVTVVLEEVVSGESLASRPKMLEALELINTGRFAGIVCMDIDRLSRGSSLDSGYITQVLQINNCKIVTPDKVYDLTDESDEQFTDMKFMFSRYELKTITKRLQAGKDASVKEGKYVGSKRPYGYKPLKLKGTKGTTLEIIPEEAKVVQMIYDMYVNQHIGYQGICNTLIDLHVPPKEGVEQWTRSGVMSILKNPLYTGKIRYGLNRMHKIIKDGKVVKKRICTPNEVDVYEGLHEPIISEELWERALETREKRLITHKKKEVMIRNEFAGILKCACCGKPYQLNSRNRPTSPMRYACRTHGCQNKTIVREELDREILTKMKIWFHDYIITIKPQEPKTQNFQLTDALESIKKRLTELDDQQDAICEKFELKEYSAKLFAKRNAAIEAEMEELNKAKADLEKKIAQQQETDIIKEQFIPTTQRLLDNHDQMTPAEQNALWKEVVEKITVEKLETKGTFTVKIYPKI